MIKTIEIENFQSHKYTLLELHPGVNVIRGRSHSGKSCITRALRWCLLNEPQGFRFKPWSAKGKDLTRVSIEFDEGTFVSRQRSSTKNEYIVGEEVLEAMRAEVPDEVSKVTRLSSINIQTQADQFYLLRGSAGAAARELNERVGLSIIDDKLTKAASIIRSLNATLKTNREELEQVENDLTKYKNLHTHLKTLERISIGIEVIHNKLSKRDSLLTLVNQMEEVEDEMAQLQPWFSVRDDVEQLGERISNQKKKQSRLESIRGLVQKIERLKGEQETLLPSIELHDAAKALLQRAIKQRSKSKETASLVRSLRLCCTDIEKKKKEGQDLWAKLRMLKIDREILIQDHKQDFCDQCGAHRKYWREVE